MNDLLNEILLDEDLENQSVDALINLLMVNGIISERFLNKGNLAYSFALLYKYYLGLKNYPKNRRKMYY